MKTEEYKQSLLAKRDELTARLDRTQQNAGNTIDDGEYDRGDMSIADDRKDAQFSETERDSTLLEQVDDALLRIEKGTFGLCEVDGEPIEEKRLKQVPWAIRCLKHQALLEKDIPKAATL